ncbi:MAG TPA: SGNH/GDSL hydrolase family protein [Opitutaceae bacterium]|nr:SGNH/GDSL hydrolase family protein [Opitutaceae bacterium]
MIAFLRGARQTIWCSLVFVTLASPRPLAGEMPLAHWVGTWVTAPLPEPAAQDQTPLAGATLRQVVHVSLGGSQLRVRFSNAFGSGPLSFHGAHVALAAPDGALQAGTDRALRFAGRAAVTIPPGASFLSDPIDFGLAPQADVAISIHFNQVPAALTTHPGSRATSYLQAGDALAAPALPAATKFTRWLFINGIDVLVADPQAAAIAILGDSITDGYGCRPDKNDRWPDELARRLEARVATAQCAVLNLGIGGNRLLRDGLGPNALARFDRDVLAPPGVRWLVVFEGINDIGTRLKAREQGANYASAADIIAADEQIIARAKAHGIRVVGATITPYAGAGFYWSADGDADRRTVNEWIRTSGQFDAVIDFDAALRDPKDPTRLAAALDCGDHLHPSIAGYKVMAESVDPALFAEPMARAGAAP